MEQLQKTATPQEVADYVRSVIGLPDRFCQAFVGKFAYHNYICVHNIDNYIDGEEFMSLSRDDINQFIKPTGLVKKIVRHLENLRGTVAGEKVY